MNRQAERLPINGPHDVDMARVKKVGDFLRNLVAQLTDIYPERDNLIQQIVYALLTRQHVLIFGKYGSGKSDLLASLFRSFEGATIRSYSLSKFMHESAVIGLPNLKTMRDEGRIEYDPVGSILDADFVELDEFLDANEPLSRVLLSILNERLFKRGRILDAKLQTAVASTNLDPVKVMERSDGMGAVIDRFLFQTRVEYLTEKESRIRMYSRYLTGAIPSARVSLEDLLYVSGVVVGANQITDPYLVEVYDHVMQEYCGRMPDQIVSDRRKCRLLQLMEANALLFGRYEVLPEDINAVRWALCMGHDKSAHDSFQAVAEPIISEAQGHYTQSLDEVQRRLLTELDARIPNVPDNADKATLVALAENLADLERQVNEVRPELPSTEDYRRSLLTKIKGLDQTVYSRIRAK